MCTLGQGRETAHSALCTNTPFSWAASGGPGALHPSKDASSSAQADRGAGKDLCPAPACGARVPAGKQGTELAFRAIPIPGL